MSQEDRVRWDDRYARSGTASFVDGLPALFAPFENVFPVSGRALDIACGQGGTSAWLARRGLEVWGIDVSPVAIRQARDLASRCGVSERCRFDVVDLDGLPAGPPFDLIVCHRFRDRRLDGVFVRRLVPGGLLAIVALSEVGAAPGPFRAVPGELPAAFAALDVIASGEARGEAWLLARA